MNQNKLNKKTENGVPLTKKEITYLAKKWRLKLSALVVFALLFLFALAITASLFIVLAQLHTTVRIILICLVAIATGVGVYFITAKKIHHIVDYLLSVDIYYRRRFDEYSGFDIITTTHDFLRSGHLQNKLCIFITDGYTFLIYDDFLHETDYFLPKKFASKRNKAPVFKALDTQNLAKRPVTFSLSEIAFYEIAKKYSEPPFEKETLAKRMHQYTYFPLRDDVSNICILELADHSIFKLGVDVYPLLRKHAPGKEKK